MSLPHPNVFLRGGPLDAAAPQRLLHVPDTRRTLKIPVGHAYEHFQPTSETVEREGNSLQVFEWSRRTYVAE
ncbi:DUF5988 family protein [Streptomyces profundus]|uniref:DUF5988 family protein n=1 Tax=Streptomyces profundus TaxID=2867410 RepID=UPI001D162FEB|nr:DUF5988 family protein [Streptomyces sp. MA3_2.13]UED87408.1 DUF5988 family protein [Streptomyces sp. MA3_2.13]